MSDATRPIDPAIAARLAELEVIVAAQRRALEEERARRPDVEAERDRLREAYEELTREVELARRRLIVAKAERIDTTQLELEFAAKLAALDELAGKVADDEADDAPKPERDKRKKKHGRRDLRLFDVPEERIEIPDPLLEGKAARIGTEESIGLRRKRGGFVRVVFVPFKYDTSTPAVVKPPTDASDALATGDHAEPSTPDAATVGDVFRVLPHWPRDRYLELAPRYRRITRARLDRGQLNLEVGSRSPSCRCQQCCRATRWLRHEVSLSHP